MRHCSGGMDRMQEEQVRADACFQSECVHEGGTQEQKSLLGKMRLGHAEFQVLMEHLCRIFGN